MQRPTITLRDLFWLLLVIGLGLGWWLDQDRIRRQRESLEAAALRLDALSLTSAERKLKVREAEFAQVMEIKQRAANCISESEFRNMKLRLDEAKADFEMALAAKEYRPKAK